MHPHSGQNTVHVGGLTAASKFLIPSVRLFGGDGMHLAIWLTRGQLRIEVNGEARTVTSDNAVIIAADTPKSIEVLSGAFGSVVALPQTPGFAPMEPLMIAKIPNIGEQQKVSALIEQVQAEVDASDKMADDAAHHLAQYLFIHLIRMAKPPITSQSAAQNLMARFTKLLEKDYRSGHGLLHYADRLGVTTTHLTRVSRELNGRSASQLIQDRVFAQARYDLATGSNRINRVGADLGFTSPAYFTRQFTEKTGLPPSDYRERHRVAKSVSSFSVKAAE